VVISSPVQLTTVLYVPRLLTPSYPVISLGGRSHSAFFDGKGRLGLRRLALLIVLGLSGCDVHDRFSEYELLSYLLLIAKRLHINQQVMPRISDTVESLILTRFVLYHFPYIPTPASRQCLRFRVAATFLANRSP
jgi:hypothetical protein